MWTKAIVFSKQRYIHYLEDNLGSSFCKFELLLCHLLVLSFVFGVHYMAQR